MTPTPNASGAIASLLLGILLVVVVSVSVASTVDDVGAFTQTVPR